MALHRRELLSHGLALAGAAAVPQSNGLVELLAGAETLVNTSTAYREYITPDARLVEFLASRSSFAGARVDLPGDPEFEYVPDQEQFVSPERWQKPTRYIRNDYRGDCDDYALFVASLAEAMGYDARVVLGVNESGGHALAEVRLGDTYGVLTVGAPTTILDRGVLAEAVRWRPAAMFGREQELVQYDPDWGLDLR